MRSHQSLLHAREWITPAAVLYVIMRLLESDDPAVTCAAGQTLPFRLTPPSPIPK